MLIDGYTHCGLSKYRPIEDVRAVMRAAGVGRAVLCQHLGEYDNTYLARVVADDPATFAAVCLIDPATPRATAELEKWHATGRFRGVRLAAAWLDAHASVWRRAVELDLTLVLYLPEGVGPAARAVRRIAGEDPGARLVVTHLGAPQLRDGRLVETELLGLANLPNVFVQLSGLSQYCAYPYHELDGFVQAVIGAYGADRVYWGSNFPVCGDETAYRRDLAQILSGVWQLTAEQTEWITGRTAEQLWFPDGAAP